MGSHIGMFGNLNRVAVGPSRWFGEHPQTAGTNQTATMALAALAVLSAMAPLKSGRFNRYRPSPSNIRAQVTALPHELYEKNEPNNDQPADAEVARW